MKKNNMKNWISLFVVASLVSACGALKKANNSGSTSSNSSTTSAKVLILNNLSSIHSEWTTDTEKFTTIAEIPADEVSAVSAENQSDVLTAIGTLSANLKSVNYPLQTDDELPKAIETNQNINYSDIKVYLTSSKSLPNAISLSVKTSDFAKLQPTTTQVVVEYNKKPAIWHIRLDGQNIQTMMVPSADGIVAECDGFGNCSYDQYIPLLRITRHFTLTDEALMQGFPKSTVVDNKDMLTGKSYFDNSSEITEYTVNLDKKYAKIALSLQVSANPK